MEFVTGFGMTSIHIMEKVKKNETTKQTIIFGIIKMIMALFIIWIILKSQSW